MKPTTLAQKFGVPQSLVDYISQTMKEETEYQMKVKALMKKKGITSLGQLSPDEKKAFFSQLDSMHQAKNEEIDEASSQYKIKSVGKDAKGDYHIDPKTGDKVYGKASVGDHKNPNTGKITPSKPKPSFMEENELEESGDMGPVNRGKEKTVMMRHKTSGKEIVVVPSGVKEKEKLGFVVVKEGIELDEGKSGTGYNLYHKDFSSAMAHAYDFAKNKYGIEVDPEEIDRKVAMGPKKPSSGKANAYRLLDKTGKKAIQVQVANLDNKRYELNMYKEDIDEAVVKGKGYDNPENERKGPEGKVPMTSLMPGHNDKAARLAAVQAKGKLVKGKAQSAPQKEDYELTQEDLDFINSLNEKK